jgi:amidase
VSDTTVPNESTSIPETARDMARAVREGLVSPRQVVERAFRRIRDRDPDIRAFLAYREEEALAEAEALARRDDLSALALAGVPIGVKDNLEVEGMAVTMGSSALHGKPAGADHAVVARLRAAGAIVVGKTSMPELGIWGTSDGFWGATRSPRHRERTGGGSSGGSGAAVAAGMVPLALGNDGLGSIRIPAACCGIAGLKLSGGMAPADLVGGDWFGMAVNGPLARTVADVALAAGVITGREDFSEEARRRPPAGGRAAFHAATVPRDGVVRSPAADRRFRIALSVSNPAPFGRVDREWAVAARDAGEALRACGHEVIEADPPYAASDALPVFARWFAGVDEATRTLEELLDSSRLQRRTRVHARLGRWVRWAGGPRSGGQRRAAHRLHAFLARFDALITPALASPPIPAGPWADRSWLSNVVANISYAPFAAPWNLVDTPAGVIPTGLHTDGTPLGVQIVGSPGDDAMVLEIMAELEDAFPPL